MGDHSDIDHTGLTGVGGTLDYEQGQLGADVTMVTAGTFYDGPTVTLAVGTWLLNGTVTIDGIGASGNITAKLWDGTTVAASTASITYGGAANRENSSLTLTAVVVIAAGTPTWKISCTGDGNNSLIKAATPTSGAGNNASTLVAVKIA